MKHKFEELLFEERPLKERFFLLSAPVALLVYMLCFLGPLEMTEANARFLDFSASDIWVLFGLLSIACIAILVGLGLLLLRGMLLDAVVSFFLGLGVCCWLQCGFLNLDLGSLTGDAIPWEHYSFHAVWNLFLWFALCLLPYCIRYFNKRLWSIVIKYTALFLLVIQVAALATILSQGKKDTTATSSYFLSDKDLFTVSKERNTIIIILDTLSTTYYEKVLEQYPDMMDGFHDFTYYNNCSNTIRGTFYAAAHLLTGHDYDPCKSYKDYLTDAWQSNTATTFYQRLHESGYKAKVYVKLKAISNDGAAIEGKVDNLVYEPSNKKLRDVKKIHNKEMIEKMLSLSAYRYFPHALKPSFWMSTSDFSGLTYSAIGKQYVAEDGDFYKSLSTNGLTVTEEDGNFIYIHLRGSHTPYKIDDKARFSAHTDGIKQTRGSLLIVETYINQLKKLGLYDSANIILAADHGTNTYPTPILFIKRSGETHDVMQINEAPVSQQDLLPTFLDLMGLSKDGFGKSIFEYDEDENRERTTRLWYNDETYPQVDGKYNVFYEYRYNAHVRDVDFTQPPQAIIPLLDSYY